MGRRRIANAAAVEGIVTKAQYLAKRKAEWLRQERRDFIDAYMEEWESEGWIEEGEAHEQELRVQWAAEHPGRSEEDWEEGLNQQLILWQAERREALRVEALGKWKEREAEYERRWMEYVRENVGENLRAGE
jgi:hypothetical protein